MRTRRVVGLDHAGAELFGRPLRHAVLAVLLGARGRSLSVTEILAALGRGGRSVDAAYPAKALADALAYEVRLGRVVRTERGRYALRRLSRGTEYRVLSRFGAPFAGL